ncbi:MFS transporter [Pseudonocardia halophobica]|uniref:MFS transporter n=1 Tax=Pseudonocardia halophobica TaxID=29401 RepID=A0A9W6NZR4_9PSEU|nr:MFS transporter [Pseudonocardia halophobica]GLL15183.1 MFS transporter [Pseudonocardia halophobica]
MSVREAVDGSSIGRFQIRVILLCLVLNMVDGFDILVMAFAASGVAREWALSGSQVGLLLSSGLAGMALGSAFVAPLADRIGRRPLTVACLAVSTAGMVLAATSTAYAGLGLARLVTGLGIGGMVASLPVLLAEYSPRRRRGATIALYAAGLPLGGVLGGSLAALLAAEFGWRGPFAAGAAITALMLIVIVLAMPESIDFLLTRRPAGALGKVNRLLARMALPPLQELPPPGPGSTRGVRAEVLRGRNGVRSVLLWIAFFVMMAAFYFAASWTPRLLEQSGLSAQQGLGGGVLLNLGGVAATLLFSLLALFISSRLLTVCSFLATGLAFLAMGLALGNLAASLVVAVVVGMVINAGAAGLFALAPDLYPASVRTTAVGWAAAFGRLGAISSPILVGLLVDRGWTPAALFGLLAIPTVLAAGAVLLMTRSTAPTRVTTGQSTPQRTA